MKTICALFAIAWCAAAQQDVKINYTSTGKTVQYVIRDLAKLAALGYNFDKSLSLTAPECQTLAADVSIRNKPFAEAMAEILDPVGLRYEVEDGSVVLYPARGGPRSAEAIPSVDPAVLDMLLINYRTNPMNRKSVQDVIADLARQVGLGYNRVKSAQLADPQRRAWVDDVSIRNKPFKKAMEKILNPVGLAYRFEGNQVVIFPKKGQPRNGR